MGGDDPIVMPAHPVACGKPVLPMDRPDNGERRSLEGAVMVLRRLLFAAWILLGLAFAVVCYAEMLGVVQFD